MAHPTGLTPEQIEEYLYRSYTRVDGLWFVLLEERFGFETALAIDRAVWRVLPKIQARLLREQLGINQDLGGLAVALKAKLGLDRYEFDLEVKPEPAVQVTLSRCPWHELMVHSGRSHLAGQVGGVICGVELPAFAREFNCSCATPSDQRLCCNGGKCVFHFVPLREPVS